MTDTAESGRVSRKGKPSKATKEKYCESSLTNEYRKKHAVAASAASKLMRIEFGKCFSSLLLLLLPFVSGDRTPHTLSLSLYRRCIASTTSTDDNDVRQQWRPSSSLTM